MTTFCLHLASFVCCKRACIRLKCSFSRHVSPHPGSTGMFLALHANKPHGMGNIYDHQQSPTAAFLKACQGQFLSPHAQMLVLSLCSNFLVDAAVLKASSLRLRTRSGILPRLGHWAASSCISSSWCCGTVWGALQLTTSGQCCCVADGHAPGLVSLVAKCLRPRQLSWNPSAKTQALQCLGRGVP